MSLTGELNGPVIQHIISQRTLFVSLTGELYRPVIGYIIGLTFELNLSFITLPTEFECSYTSQRDLELIPGTEVSNPGARAC